MDGRNVELGRLLCLACVLACSPLPVPRAPNAHQLTVDEQYGLRVDGQALGETLTAVRPRWRPADDRPVAVFLPGDTPAARAVGVWGLGNWFGVDGRQGDGSAFSWPRTDWPDRPVLVPRVDVHVSSDAVKGAVLGWTLAHEPVFTEFRGPWRSLDGRIVPLGELHIDALWPPEPDGPMPCDALFDDPELVDVCHGSEAAKDPAALMLQGEGLCLGDHTEDVRRSLATSLERLGLGSTSLVRLTADEDVPWERLHGVLGAMADRGVPLESVTTTEGALTKASCGKGLTNQRELQREAAAFWGAWWRKHQPLATIERPDFGVDTWTVHVVGEGLYLDDGQWAPWPLESESESLAGLRRAVRRRENPGALVLPPSTTLADAARVRRAMGGARHIGRTDDPELVTHEDPSRWPRDPDETPTMLPIVAVHATRGATSAAVRARIVGWEYLHGPPDRRRLASTTFGTGLPWVGLPLRNVPRGGCEAVYPAKGERRALCEAADAPERVEALALGGSDGCFAGPGATATDREAWASSWPARLTALGLDPRTQLLVRPDDALSWGEWVRLRQGLAAAGFTRVSLRGRPDEVTGPLGPEEPEEIPDPSGCEGVLRTAEQVQQATARAVGQGRSVRAPGARPPTRSSAPPPPAQPASPSSTPSAETPPPTAPSR